MTKIYDEINENELLDAAEKIFDSKNYPNSIYNSISNLNEFLKSPKADIKNKDKFEELSPKIAQLGYGEGAQLVYIYCKRIVKRRLSNEKIEIDYLNSCAKGYRSLNVIYKYARYILRGKYPESIEKNIKVNYNYIDYLQKNNLEYVDVLLDRTDLSLFFYKYNLYLPKVVHNFMMTKKIMGDRYADSYFRSLNKNNKFILKVIKNLDENMSIKELKEILR